MVSFHKADCCRNCPGSEASTLVAVNVPVISCSAQCEKAVRSQLMTSDMAFECLLISRDPRVVGLFFPVLKELSMEMNICLRPSKAVEIITEDDTDLIVIDWESSSEYAEVLKRLPNSSGHRKTIVVALSASDCDIANADIVVRKPLTAEAASSALRMAYAKMLHEYRRYVRYPIMITPETAEIPNGSVRMLITDLGYGGLQLTTCDRLAVGDVINCRLRLPDTKRSLEFHGRVLWTMPPGMAGCDFLRISPESLSTLCDWVECKNRIKKPSIGRSQIA
jgi:hypothetical protein